MVSPYPPIRDGIGIYAAQEVRPAPGEGHDVEVLSPQPSAAHHHLRLPGSRGAAALGPAGRRLRPRDRPVPPRRLLPLPLVDRRAVGGDDGAPRRLHARRNVEFRIHEFKCEWGGRGPNARLLRRLWNSAATRIEVHTETERDAVRGAFGIDR